MPNTVMMRRPRCAGSPGARTFRVLARISAMLAATVALCVVMSAPAAWAEPWVAAWSASPDQAGPSLGGKTIRQVIRTSVGGPRVRVRFSNLYGSAPLTLGPVRLARPAGGPSVQPGSDRAVTFGGHATVTIPKGGAVLSDSVEFPVGALEEVAISLYVPPGAGASTLHGVGRQSGFFAAGDATASPTLTAAAPAGSRHFLTDLDVAAGPGAGSLVIVGDSITDGVGSTKDRSARWPDALAARLQSDPTFAAVGVVNAGVAGNRLLNGASDPFVGPSMLSRFDRDALMKSGVRWVLLLAGINDIAAADMLGKPEDQVSAAQVSDGLKMLAGRARAQGFKVFGGTLLPVADPAFLTPGGEAKRQAVNAWIRTGGAFDAVIDFDQALRDPADPGRIRAEFDSGDHLHPNDAGYAAMAAAIDLRLFADAQPR